MEKPWLVVFTDFEPLEPAAPLFMRLAQKLLERMLKPGFRHVFAVRELRGGAFLLVSPLWSGSNVLMLERFDLVPGSRHTIVEWWLGLQVGIKKGLAHGLWVAPPLAQRTCPPLAPLTCVSAIAHLVGAPLRYLTPYQLYRYLNSQAQEN